MKTKTPPKFFHALFVLSFLFVLGCNLAGTAGGNEPRFVTATPATGPRIITATPEMTATFAPIATPDLPTSSAVTSAQKALFNGDYVGAVNQYQAILAQNNNDEALRSAAYYGLGQAALREGLYVEAIEAFTQFIALYAVDPRIPQAYFQRGDAYLGLGSWEAAILDFQMYLQQRPGVIDSYAYERIADAYLALEQYNLAFQNYVAAANSTRTLEPMLALRERIATVYLNQGEYQLALEQYDSILTESLNANYAASIELKAAQLEYNIGSTEAAFTRFQRIVNNYPNTDSAYHALSALVDNGYVVDALVRADINFINEDYGGTIEALNIYATQVPTMPTDRLLMLGRAYRALGNFETAFATFQTIIDQYPNDPNFGQALLDQGRTYYYQGDYVGAITHYSSIATDYPDIPEAPEALWRVGYIYSVDLGDVERALATYDILGQTYPGDSWAIDGLVLGAEMALAQGQLQRAQVFYTQIANTGTGEPQAEAFFWLGRLYREQGNMDSAMQSFQGASLADPDGYYSRRATDILAGTEPFTPPADTQFEFDEGAALAEAEQWLRTTFGIEQAGLLYPLSEALKNNSHMVRGLELQEVGAFDDARAEFEDLRTEYEGDPLATYQLAHFFSQIGAYRQSIEEAADLIIASGQSTFEAPSYIARLRFPIYYADLVLPNAEEYGLDPLLVFALIRQESLYQGFATSYAYAQGLMQIIPDTGYWIAQQLAWEDYENNDVYRPYINVQFGTYYLSWVLTYVGGSKFAALAGYNGGPGNAKTWLDISGDDIDRFIQTVEFDESKAYVTRIYEQYNAYKFLYGKE